MGTGTCNDTIGVLSVIDARESLFDRVRCCLLVLPLLVLELKELVRLRFLDIYREVGGGRVKKHVSKC